MLAATRTVFGARGTAATCALAAGAPVPPAFDAVTEQDTLWVTSALRTTYRAPVTPRSCAPFERHA